MIVSELIQILQELDPNARVLLMSQESWPFENDISNVTTREIMGEEEHTHDTAASDVFIVEGQQLRYGSKAAWNR